MTIQLPDNAPTCNESETWEPGIFRTPQGTWLVGDEYTGPDNLHESGSPIGIGNLPFQQLANRTAFLKAVIAGLQSSFVGAVQYFATAQAPEGWLVCDGSTVLRADYPDLFARLVTDSGFDPQTFTVTISADAVFTKSAHGFNGNERLRLSTTGALPTGLDAATDYYVRKINVNTFYLALNPDGAAITTSGTQSGTHSFQQSLWGLGNGTTTFNLPNLLDNIAKGSGALRQVGTRQKGTPVAIDLNAPGVWTLSSTTSVLEQIGGDEFSQSNYAFIGCSGANAVGNSQVTGTELMAVVTRPNNTALLPCIKY